MSDEKILVILFPDATMLTAGSRYGATKKMYQKGARFFEVNDGVPIGALCDFYARQFDHKKFTEITDQIPES